MMNSANRTVDGKEVPFITSITIPDFFDFRGSILDNKYIDMCEFISTDRHIVGKFLDGKMIQGMCHFFDSPQHKIYLNNNREVLHVKNGVGRYCYFDNISQIKHFVAINTDSLRYYTILPEEKRCCLIFEATKSYTMYNKTTENCIKTGSLFGSDFPGRKHWIDFICHYKIPAFMALSIWRVPFTIMKYDIYSIVERKSHGGICIVCHEAPAIYMFDNCKHLCMCISCYNTLDQRSRCVVCRAYTTCSRVYF